MSNTSHPAISIIMPVYNGELYLDDSISSVLAQTFSNFELICVNDGSSDASTSKINEYAKKDSRIYLFTKKNEGPGMALNWGIQQAKGTFLCFLDQDDKYTPDYLEKMYQAITTYNTDLVLCYGKYFSSTSQLDDDSLGYPSLNQRIYSLATLKDKLKLLHCFIPQWTKIIRKDFILQHHITFPNKHNKAHDYPFHALCLYFANNVSIVFDKIYLHRKHSAQISNGVMENTNHWLIQSFYDLKTYYKNYISKDPEFMLFTLEFINGIRFNWLKRHYLKILKSYYKGRVHYHDK